MRASSACNATTSSPTFPAALAPKAVATMTLSPACNGLAERSLVFVPVCPVASEMLAESSSSVVRFMCDYSLSVGVMLTVSCVAVQIKDTLPELPCIRKIVLI